MNAAELSKSVSSVLDKSNIRDLEDVAQAAKRENQEIVCVLTLSFVVSHVFLTA